MSTPRVPLMPDAAADEERRRGLRRMRMVALGLLILAAVVYIATMDRDGVWGFVNAGAEASMVGAIADWFAVTALFRHPLGLPIPHTALVPRRKDELGTGLQEFVVENFLHEEIVRERIADARVPQRVGAWVLEGENADRTLAEFCDVATIGLGNIRDEHIQELVEAVLVPRFHEEPISPLLGSLLTEVLADEVHRGLVDLGLDEIGRWLVDNPEIFARVLAERAPWWAPERLNDVIITRLHGEALKWIADIRSDPHHEARQALDSMLHQLAADLLEDPETQERTEGLKRRLLEHPQVIETGVSLWQALRGALVAALADEQSHLRVRLRAELLILAERLTTDEALAARAEKVLSDVVVFGVDRYGAELTTVITHTIASWDGREAAERIELHVGRDLQFIRINGTIVGGLVGVAIHTISVLIA